MSSGLGTKTHTSVNNFPHADPVATRTPPAPVCSAPYVARVVGGEVRNATGTISAGGTDVPLRQHGQEGPKDVLLLMVLLPPFVEAVKEAVSRCIETELIYIIILYDIADECCC